MKGISGTKAAVLVATSVVFTSAAQLLFSYVMKQTNAELTNVASVLLSLPAANTLYLALGVILYAASMLAWIVALTRFPVSLAYPMLSVSYVIVYAAAALLPVFGESVSIGKSLGVGLIALGISVLFLDKTLDDQSETVSGR
jgi:undecaprenyl phosphate-alpha-L-ara4N flippase subunit ArnF